MGEPWINRSNHKRLSAPGWQPDGNDDNIGVLALQGDFAEHIVMLRQIGAEAVEVRLPSHLEGLDGLIIPGGESTTIGKLAVRMI